MITADEFANAWATGMLLAVIIFVVLLIINWICRRFG
jgi:uncharacterized membrane protein YdbT with pleckstrin-like domain